jgi:hypothetical protein
MGEQMNSVHNKEQSGRPSVVSDIVQCDDQTFMKEGTSQF